MKQYGPSYVIKFGRCDLINALIKQKCRTLYDRVTGMSLLIWTIMSQVIGLEAPINTPLTFARPVLTPLQNNNVRQR